MKLITKIGVYFNISSLLIYVAISIGTHSLVNQSIKEEANTHLKNITQKVIQEIKKGGVVNYPPFIEIEKVDSIVDEPGFEDVWVEFENQANEEHFRQLLSYENINGTLYKITSRISLEEKQDLFISISLLLISSLILFNLIMFFVNKYLSRRIFRDFYSTISALENFSLTSKKTLTLQNSNIKEFDKLNQSLNYLSEQALKEYKVLQEFTEDLNHELKTPIAVIQSKLELLFENPERTRDELIILNSAIKNLTKLQRLNKSLILLNQLDNIVHMEKSKIDVISEIQNILSNFSEYINEMKLRVFLNKIETEDKITIHVNPQLFNLLMTNLISNAIKHNLNNGKINIEVSRNGITISNTGQPPKESIENYFKRFYKDSESSDSVGLGLTIVNKIIDLFGFKLDYNYTNNLHIISIIF